MARLPLADWPYELVERRLDFLAAAARFVPPGIAPGGERLTGGSPAGERVSDVHALMAAADLAFATDRTRRGLDYLGAAVAAMVERDADVRPAALPGAITGQITTSVSPSGAQLAAGAERSVARRPVAIERFVPLPPASPLGRRLLVDLLFANAASGVRLDDALVVGVVSPELPGAQTGDPIVQALRVFLGDADGGDASAGAAVTGLITGLAQWDEDLRIHRADAYHWEQGRVRGALVDMRLLAFHLGWIRRRDGLVQRRIEQVGRLLHDLPLPEGVRGLDRFVSELALEIARELEPDLFAGAERRRTV